MNTKINFSLLFILLKQLFPIGILLEKQGFQRGFTKEKGWGRSR